MISWEQLEATCAQCDCCALGASRTNCVFGVGNREARLMFVGEAPGADEDAQGVPFVGRAGQLLTDLLASVGISRDEVYIANILKCRPPNNRDPLPEEEDACIGYLRAQVALIRPAMLVCLGRVAAKRIIDKDYQIMKQHGQWIERGGVAMTAVLHPSALLRSPGNRPMTYLDFVDIAKRLRNL